MALKCDVCESKQEEILFLRAIIKDLLEKKKEDEKVFIPFYENESGETVPAKIEPEGLDVIG